MGKTGNTILGIGLAGSILGLHLYMFANSDDKCTVKDEVKEAMEDIKKAASRLT